MKKTIIFSILVLGITSVIGQLVVIRETTINFYGNEFFIGWTLFSWLFWTGIGSLFLGKLFANKNASKTLVLCHFLTAIFLVGEIVLARFFYVFKNEPTGQVPDLISAMSYAFIILAPLCLFLGLQFATTTRLWKKSVEAESLEKIVGKAYFLETIGFIAGSLFFNYFLTLFNEFRIVSVLAWINVLSISLIVFVFKEKFFLKFSAVILIIPFFGIIFFSQNIDIQTKGFRFPNQILIESKNSIYGNITITKLKDQYNFYESGLLLGTNKEEVSNEYLAHLPLLYHQDPKKILLIGTGFNGMLKEIIKYKPDRVYYLEIDPILIEEIKKYLSPELKEYLSDERIKIINTDARYFVKTTSEKFDLALINLPNPSTALIDRLYTEEFFKEVKSRLNPEGILATYLSSSPNYFGQEIKDLDASVFWALKRVFASVIVLPEEEHLFIASTNKLDYNPEILIQRLKQRNIKNNFVNETYIKYRLTNDRVQKLLSMLEENKLVKTNQDQLPISYYYNFVYWVSSFYPNLAKFFQSLANIKFIWLIIFLILGSVLVLFSSRGKRKDNTKNLIFAMAIAGFSLMAMEMIIVLGFQVFYGDLYYKLSLIIASLMAGLAIGNWLGTKFIKKVKIGSLIKIHILIAVFSLIILIGFYFLLKTSLYPSSIIELLFVAAAIIIGTIIGLEFPIVNALYLSKKQNASQKTGIVYGADLIGSCLGASLVSIFFVPIFGIFQTLIFLVILNILTLISLIYSTSSSEKT